MIENWKTIEGFKAYEVSDQGQVRRRLLGGSPNAIVGHVLTACPNTKGYLQLGLTKDGKTHPKRVHRLVAEAFIPNPLGLPEVNHTGAKTDNRAIKLEWMSVPMHATDTVRRGQKGKGVYFNKRSGKWIAHYTPITGKKYKYLGAFGSHEEAKAARDKAVASL